MVAEEWPGKSIAVAHEDPAVAARLATVAEEPRRAAEPTARAFASGRTVRVDDLSTLDDGGEDRLLEAIGADCALFVPLRPRGRTLGTMTLLRGRDRPFSDAEIELAEELARRAALALDNARLYSELQLADRRKDEFLAMLAHELRNPLAPVSTSLQLLKLRRDDPEVLRRTLEIMERQIGHIVRLVDDLLDVARITRGKIELQRRRVDLEVLIGDAVESLRPRFAARAQTLTVHPPAEPLPIDADPTRLEQVLANLLSNASKYTEHGGHVELTAHRDGGFATVTVSDDGVGMPPELLTRVFELFMQSERALDRSEGGLGIGLTLVRQLVEMHGGTVTAHSDGPGRGSRFVVRLPLAILAQDEPPAEPSADSAPQEGRDVLVVDDNVEGAEALAELLRIWGHRVRTVYDGAEAVRRALESPPDVILLDIGLPGLDGYQVAERLRSHPQLAATTLIAVTGYGPNVHGSRLDDLGFAHLLVKPVRAQRSSSGCCAATPPKDRRGPRRSWTAGGAAPELLLDVGCGSPSSSMASP